MSGRLRLVVGLLCWATGLAAWAGDPAGAERQYRVARRLAAEGSVEAAAALRKVVELDPAGPLADDALVDQALLLGLARWPEELGGIGADPAALALGLLSRVVDLPGSDRVLEARHLRGLLRLEPLTLHDASAARLDLLAVANSATGEPARAAAARYAVAWLDQRMGRLERAGDAYQRLIVERPASATAARARVGLGAILLRQGRGGDAARVLDEAAATGAPASLGAPSAKELAVRAVLEGLGAAPAPGRPRVVATNLGTRSPAGFAATPAGGIVLADRRAGTVRQLDAEGAVTESWTVDAPQALAVTRSGRIFVVAGERIYRLEPGRPPVLIALAGEFADARAVAADDLGRLWLVDRRGEAIGLSRPGEGLVRRLSESKGARLVSIAWDGLRLFAADGRSGNLVAIGPDGATATLGGATFERPSQVAVDPLGRAAVLDVKAERVVYVGADGRLRYALDLRTFGVARAAGMALGADGTLHLFDAETQSWVRVP